MSDIQLKSKKILQETKVAKQRLVSEEAKCACLQLHLESLEQQEEVLESQIEELRDGHSQLARAVTGVLDGICQDVEDFTELIGVTVDQESVSQTWDQRSGLVRELEELENIYEKVNRLEAAITDRDNVAKELEQTGKSVCDKRELRDLLKSESQGLMENIHSLNLERSDSSSSVAAQEVKQLRIEMSKLVQSSCTHIPAELAEWSVQSEATDLLEEIGDWILDDMEPQFSD